MSLLLCGFDNTFLGSCGNKTGENIAVFILVKIKPCRLSKQLDSVTENPFVFCGYKVSHVIGQNTHSMNIFSVHGFLNLSVSATRSSNMR